MSEVPLGVFLMSEVPLYRGVFLMSEVPLSRGVFIMSEVPLYRGRGRSTRWR